MTHEIEGTTYLNPSSGHTPPDSVKELFHPQKVSPNNCSFLKAPDCFACHDAMVDHSGIIIAVNQFCQDLPTKNVTQGKLMTEGVSYFEIFKRSEELFSAGGKTFATGLRAVLDRQMDRFEMKYPSNSGEDFQWFLGRIIGLDIKGLRYAFVHHQDFSDYKNQKDQSISQNAQLPTLLDTVKSLVSMLDLQALLNTILIKLSNLIRYNATAVFTFENGNIILQAYQGPPLSIRSPIILTPKERYPEIHQLVFDKHAFIIQNIKAIPSLSVELSELLNLERDNLERFHSWIFLPMMVNENQIGIMVLAYHEEGHYDQDALRIGQLFTNYAAIAIQNAHLYELSQQSGILQERNRLAFELHDSIAQSLYSINLYTQATQRALETEKIESAKRNLKILQRLSGEAVKDMRLMIFELNTQLLEEFGIEKAILARFEAIEAKQGIQTCLSVEGELELPNQLACEVYGIIQELLNYIEKNFKLDCISIIILAVKARIYFEINFGKKINFEELTEDANIEILNRIKERIHKLGGRLQFNFPKNRGTEIKFSFDIK
jgi:signal transduction histidine kinase